MGHRETILDVLEQHGPLCDDCIGERAGIEPRQTVNITARKLDAAGELARRKARCGGCATHKLLNYPGEGTGERSAPAAVTLEPAPPRSPRLARLDAVLERLATVRPIFHSEADFQHALAWELHEAGAKRIRLERRFESIGGHLDLLAKLDGERLGLELKYWKSPLEVLLDGEPFSYTSQGAQDISRYDFVKDLTRLERLVAAGDVDAGLAVALTNDRGYWNPGRGGTIDAALRLHQGRVLEGALGWAPHAGAGTTKGREAELSLRGRYVAAWRDFSTVPADRNGTLRYLALEVFAPQAEDPSLISN